MDFKHLLSTFLFFSPLSMSSKMWLKKHGLAAKNLTIYDALGNTVVKQRAKYVPILDKHVVSQVFNEVSQNS